MKDIQDINDVKLLVDSFYDKVNKDSLLSPVFNDHSKVDWPKHLPRMYEFWSSLLLGTMTYKGAPFPKHAHLPIDENHFQRWMELFFQTIDEHFKGEKADEAKMRAVNIGNVFQYKMGILKI